MPPLNAPPSRCDRINRDPTVAPNICALRLGGPARGFMVRFMQSLLRALHESRSDQAQREIHRFRHLIPTDAVKTGEQDPEASPSDEPQGQLPSRRRKSEEKRPAHKRAAGAVRYRLLSDHRQL
jgi:hypothetical protein